MSKPALVGLITALLVSATGVLVWLHLWLPKHSTARAAALPGQDALAETLRAHVTAIASRPHNVSHPAELEAAARYIEGQLAQLGYEVERQEYTAAGAPVRNIAVAIPAVGHGAVSVGALVVGAHYDSYLNAPGANDNGTGVAALLEIARALRGGSQGASPIRLVFFVNEEPPFFDTPDMGSRRYAASLAARGVPVSSMLSLETLGAFSDEPGSQTYPAPFGRVFPDRGNFVAFVGTLGSRQFLGRAIASFRRHSDVPSLGGLAPAIVQGVDWSDHKSFAERGIPAVMITDTALYRYAYYHTPADTPDKIDYATLARLTHALTQVIRDLTGVAREPI
jgi:Zn-dependent M28 family amino/carboxypeptidase